MWLRSAGTADEPAVATSCGAESTPPRDEIRQYIGLGLVNAATVPAQLLCAALESATLPILKTRLQFASHRSLRACHRSATTRLQL